MSLTSVLNEYHSGQIAKGDYIKKIHGIHRLLFEYADYLPGTDIESIQILDGKVVLELKGTKARFIIDRADERSIPLEALNFKSYERSEFEMIVKLSGEKTQILDIGGNIGWYAVQLGLLKKRAKIWSFEPIPSTYDYLKANLELNGIRNVTACPFGFSDKEDTLTFYFYPEGTGNASMANLSKQASVREIRCKVTTLDRFCEENGLKPGFIKCDVEGAELFVFRGGLETLKKHRPVVFTEMLRKWAKEYRYHPNEIIALFKDLDYSCYRIQEGRLGSIAEISETTQETNFIFLHPEKHQKILETLSF